MKAKTNVPQKGKFPGPPPNGNTGSIESRKRTLSKDELIDLLERSLEECVDSAEDVINTNIPLLLFLAAALNQDDPIDMILRIKGRDTDYCHTGNGVAPILERLAVELYEAWNKIDASHLPAWGVMQDYRKGHPNAASSR
jgi:hypothetical protein